MNQIKQNKEKSNFTNKMKDFFSEPSNTILVIAAILLSITILVPLGFLFLNTLKFKKAKHSGFMLI